MRSWPGIVATLAGLHVFGEFFFGAERLPTASATRLGWMTNLEKPIQIDHKAKS